MKKLLNEFEKKYGSHPNFPKFRGYMRGQIATENSVLSCKLREAQKADGEPDFDFYPPRQGMTLQQYAREIARKYNAEIFAKWAGLDPADEAENLRKAARKKILDGLPYRPHR